MCNESIIMTTMYRSRKSFNSSSFCTEVWSRATIINLIPGSKDLSTTQSKFQKKQNSAENKTAIEYLHGLLRLWTKCSQVEYILKRILLSKTCFCRFVCQYISTKTTQNSPSKEGMNIYKH